MEHGDPKAAAELLPIVYEELRRLAAQKLAREAAGHTLQPTALGIAVPTAKQWWAYARAWLTVELRGSTP